MTNTLVLVRHDRFALWADKNDMLRIMKDGSACTLNANVLGADASPDASTTVAASVQAPAGNVTVDGTRYEAAVLLAESVVRNGTRLVPASCDPAAVDTATRVPMEQRVARRKPPAHNRAASGAQGRRAAAGATAVTP